MTFIYLYLILGFFKLLRLLSFIIPPIRRMMLIPVPIKNHLSTRQNRNGTIPKKIHQTYKSNELPLGLYLNTLTWRILNPEFDYYYYDDLTCDEYIEKHFPDYISDYRNLTIPAAKADLFRYLVVYREGGFYADIDSICLTPLAEYVGTGDTEVAFRLICFPRDFLQCIFGFRIGHPILKEIIDQVIRNIRNRISNNVLEVTGPRPFSTVLKKNRFKCMISYKYVESIGFWAPRYSEPQSYWRTMQKIAPLFLN